MLFQFLLEIVRCVLFFCLDLRLICGVSELFFCNGCTCLSMMGALINRFIQKGLFFICLLVFL